MGVHLLNTIVPKPRRLADRIPAIFANTLTQHITSAVMCTCRVRSAICRARPFGIPILCAMVAKGALPTLIASATRSIAFAISMATASRFIAENATNIWWKIIERAPVALGAAPSKLARARSIACGAIETKIRTFLITIALGLALGKKRLWWIQRPN